MKVHKLNRKEPTKYEFAAYEPDSHGQKQTLSQAAFELKVIETCIHVVTAISSLDKPTAKGAGVCSQRGGHPHHPLRDRTLFFVDHGTYSLRLLDEFAGLKTSTDLESSQLQARLAAPELDQIDPRRSIYLRRVAYVGESRGLSCRERKRSPGGLRSGICSRSLYFQYIKISFALGTRVVSFCFKDVFKLRRTNSPKT